MFFGEPKNLKEEEVALDREGQIKNFRKNAKSLVDYICDYAENVEKKFSVSPDVEPGFLRPLFPPDAPIEPERFDKILDDFDKKIMPGLLHKRHTDYYAYFSCGAGLPNIFADMLSTAIGSIPISWVASPAGTELENIMLDWLGRAINLPPHLLYFDSHGRGGGVIQSGTSEAILSVFVAARYRTLHKLGCYATSNKVSLEDSKQPGSFLPRMICYTSREAHSSVEKAANIAMIEIRLLEPNENHQITGSILEKAIEKDKMAGRIPVLFVGCAGSTGIATFDKFSTCGPVCKNHDLWFHVDGAYGGGAFILPEMRYLMNGLEYADSFNISAYKLLLVAIDLGALYLRDTKTFKQAFLIDAVYLLHKEERQTFDFMTRQIDYRDYGVALSRRMRSLKLYFVMKHYGIRGLQDHIRRIMFLAKLFESSIRQDDRFVVTSPASIGVVCFRQKSPIESQVNFQSARSDYPLSHANRLNMNLLYRINKSREIHMCPYSFNGLYHLRISVNHEFSTEDDIKRAWAVIQSNFVDELDEEWLELSDNHEPDHEMQRKKSNLSFVELVHVSKLSRSSSKLQTIYEPVVIPIDSQEQNELKRS